MEEFDVGHNESILRAPSGGERQHCSGSGKLTSERERNKASNESCELIKHYLMGRQQCVKIGIVKSDWCELRKGVPQGSILGPLLFNIFINDLFYFLVHLCTLFNYADDNSISHSHQDMAELSADVAVEWLRNNNMQANPSKFQGIIIARGNDVATPVTVNIRDIDIPVNENVKVLGIHIDNKLKFDKHISELCKRHQGI